MDEARPKNIRSDENMNPDRTIPIETKERFLRVPRMSMHDLTYEEVEAMFVEGGDIDDSELVELIHRLTPDQLVQVGISLGSDFPWFPLPPTDEVMHEMPGFDSEELLEVP